MYRHTYEWNERTVKKRACLVNRERMVPQDFVKISSERDAPSILTLTSYGNLFQKFCDRRKLGEHATKFEKSSRNEFQKNENYLCIKPGLDA